MKKWFLKMLTTVLAENRSELLTKIIGEEVAKRIMKLDPNRRYIMILPEPSSDDDVAVVDALIRKVTADSDVYMAVIFSDNVRILEM